MATDRRSTPSTAHRGRLRPSPQEKAPEGTAMTRTSPRRRWAGRIGLAAASAFVTAVGLMAAATPAAAQPAGASVNPYAPNYQHSYRHGAVPTREALQNMRSY